MPHSNKDEFLKVLERTSAQTGFPLRLLEKDYYITNVLSRINELSKDLVFKGGTCLSKIYYSYYRLSEDLDFTLKLPFDKSTRISRRNAIRPIKEALRSFLKNFNMRVEGLDKAGHRESTQYIYYLNYDSVVLNKKESIKLEIGLRFNPILPVVTKKVNHNFLHPFTKAPLFDVGSVKCLALKELVGEKLRAAATRKVIAARDFYDLGFLLREKFNFNDKEQLELFRKKLEEDGVSSDLVKYQVNLGRTDKEIDEMMSRIQDELFPVLTLDEQKSFDMPKTIDELNKVFVSIK
ncbi:nucleotidyl transferase AbiEii/AbiGii toxin family protein [Patescibacteria group bacterium]|nr:nucleotidyl transferase AbiEii/AbiGii toxin family protein [Patescibacteria group bacterium]